MIQSDIRLIREAASFIEAVEIQETLTMPAKLRTLADRTEAQMKQSQEPVAWFEKTASGEWFLAYSLNPLAETEALFTYPPDAATRIAELEADNARLIREMLVLSVDHEAQLAEYKADAERYRWLRDIGDETWSPMCERGISKLECDAAIDEAIAKVKRGKNEPNDF